MCSAQFKRGTAQRTWIAKQSQKKVVRDFQFTPKRINAKCFGNYTPLCDTQRVHVCNGNGACACACALVCYNMS